MDYTSIQFILLILTCTEAISKHVGICFEVWEGFEKQNKRKINATNIFTGQSKVWKKGKGIHHMCTKM